MPDILRSLYNHNENSIDKILGINEQIENMAKFKNISAEDKIYYWLTGTGSFTMDVNFNEAQLNYAKTLELNEYR